MLAPYKGQVPTVSEGQVQITATKRLVRFALPPLVFWSAYLARGSVHHFAIYDCCVMHTGLHGATLVLRITCGARIFAAAGPFRGFSLRFFLGLFGASSRLLLSHHGPGIPELRRRRNQNDVPTDFDCSELNIAAHRAAFLPNESPFPGRR